MSSFSRFKKINNKGSIFDVVSLIVGVITIVITLMIAMVVYNSFQTEWENANMSDHEYEAETNYTFDRMIVGLTMADKMFFPVAIIGMTIGLIITSFFIPSHPIFMVINIIGLFFVIFLSIVFQAVYEQLQTMEYLNTTTGYLPYSGVVMDVLPWISVGAILIATVIGYAKRNQGLM